MLLLSPKARAWRSCDKLCRQAKLPLAGWPCWRDSLLGPPASFWCFTPVFTVLQREQTRICYAASSRNLPAVPAAGTQAACSACHAPAPGMQLDVESRPSPVLRYCFSSERVDSASEFLVHAVCLNKKACSQDVFVPLCPWQGCSLFTG